MDTFYISLCLLLTLIALIALITVFVKKKIFKKIWEKFAWNSIIRSSLQTYFPTCILIFQAFTENSETTLAIAAKTCTVILIPFFSFCILKKNKKKIKGKKLYKKYGSLYLNLDRKKHSVYIHTSIFCLQRLIISTATALFKRHIAIMVIVYNTCGFFSFSYFRNYMPMQSRELNKVE